MDWYLLVKFLHVMAAIIWLGGGFCLLVIALIAERANNDEQLVTALRSVVMLGNTLFVPAALATLVFGGVLVWLSWSVTDFWILLALAGFVASFVLGTVVMKPRADRLMAAYADEGVSEGVAAQSRQLLRIARFDFVILFSILAVMVLKPQPGDIGILVTLAFALVAGAVAFLMPPSRVQADAT